MFTLIVAFRTHFPKDLKITSLLWKATIVAKKQGQAEIKYLCLAIVSGSCLNQQSNCT